MTAVVAGKVVPGCFLASGATSGCVSFIYRNLSVALNKGDLEKETLVGWLVLFVFLVRTFIIMQISTVN